MSYIAPDFRLIRRSDKFISLLYNDKTVKKQGVETREETNEIKTYMALPFAIDPATGKDKAQLKNMERIKFNDDIFCLATLPDNSKLIIDENGNLKKVDA